MHLLSITHTTHPTTQTIPRVIRRHRFGRGCPALTALLLLATLLLAPGHTAAAPPPATFSAQTAFTVGNVPLAVAVADVNGDGKPDLVVPNYIDGTAGVLLNTTATGATTPTFSAQTAFTVGNGPNSVAVADVNGDGKPDLVVTNYIDDTLSVLLNSTATGATTPTFATQATFGVGNFPTSLAIADMNGDGKPDLATTNYGDGTVSVLLGNGDGTFATLITFAVGNGPQSVAVADVNGDGKPDLVVANYIDGTAGVLLNTTAIGATTPTFSAQTPFTVGNSPRSVTVADVNGDGKPDLVVAISGDNTVGVLLGTGNGAFGTQTTFGVGNSPQSVAVADVNGDGKRDLVVANTSGTSVSVLLNTSPVDLAITATGSPTAVVPGRIVTYTLTATDTGVNATGTTGTFALDPNLTYQSAAFTSGATGTVSQSGGTVNFAFASGLANGATATLTVTAQVVAAPTATIATSAATITKGASDVETNTANNTTPVTTTLLAPITLAPAAPLPAAGFGTAYTQAITASGGTGTGFTYAVTSGALPPGLTFTGNTLAGTPTAVGIYTFTMTATDIGGNTGSQPYPLTVVKASTTTSVTASPSPSVFGQSVTLMAMVTGRGGTPTGTVTFTSGTTTLGMGTLNSMGVAMASTTTLPVGANQTITATYNGDANFASSTGTTSVTVNLAMLTVTAPTGSGSGNSGSATMPVVRVGALLPLAAQSGGNAVTGVTYTSSDPSTVAVDSTTGVVTALHAGTVTITATGSNRATGSITVTVLAATGTGLMAPGAQPITHAVAPAMTAPPAPQPVRH